MRIGYVSLNFDYSASSLPIGFNVHIKGPILLSSPIYAAAKYRS